MCMTCGLIYMLETTKRVYSCLLFLEFSIKVRFDVDIMIKFFCVFIRNKNTKREYIHPHIILFVRLICLI